MQSLKNDINDLIKEAKTDEERTEIIAKGKEIKSKLEEKTPIFEKINGELESLMLGVPNIPTDDTPVGKDESENKVLRQVGEDCVLWVCHVMSPLTCAALAKP